MLWVGEACLSHCSRLQHAHGVHSPRPQASQSSPEGREVLSTVEAGIVPQSRGGGAPEPGHGCAAQQLTCDFTR